MYFNILGFDNLLTFQKEKCIFTDKKHPRYGHPVKCVCFYDMQPETHGIEPSWVSFLPQIRFLLSTVGQKYFFTCDVHLYITLIFVKK